MTGLQITDTLLQKVADNIDDVDEFGDLPPPVMHRLSQILSRNRAVTPKTLDLFLRPEHRELNIYDCASECSICASLHEKSACMT
jgi:DNA repair protein RAD7